MRSTVYVDIISSSILRLHEFPLLPIGEHIANALDGRDIYGVGDKELAQILTRYLDNYERTF